MIILYHGLKALKIFEYLPHKIYLYLCTLFNLSVILILGPLIDIMGGTIFITARSIMSKIVESNELGWYNNIIIFFLLVLICYLFFK